MKAGDRGGPLGLGAGVGDGGPAGREDAAGGAGTAGVEAPGTVGAEAPGTALDGTRGPDGKAGTGVFCGGTTFVGVFNGGATG